MPEPHPGPSTPTTSAAQVQWHLAEVAAILRQDPRPFSPELLRITLRGVGELCRVLFERGQETPAEPPFLFRNDPVVAEALGMWEQRVRAAMAEQRPALTR
jgi:hypothetical protein